MKNCVADFFYLFFPETCITCKNALHGNEKLLCSTCKFQLPETNFHLSKNNPVAQLFWGRVELQNCTAYLNFTKGGKVQRMLHLLKYKNRPDIAVYLGKCLGTVLKKEKTFANIDLIVPVPLSGSKQKKRGYNQSHCFAEGLSAGLQIPCAPEVLRRNQDTSTQTNKSRFERWENVERVFDVHDPERIRKRHVLLVDDVITTGATIEACAQVLIDQAQAQVSIASIAFAVNN